MNPIIHLRFTSTCDDFTPPVTASGFGTTLIAALADMESTLIREHGPEAAFQECCHFARDFQDFFIDLEYVGGEFTSNDFSSPETAFHITRLPDISISNQQSSSLLSHPWEIRASLDQDTQEQWVIEVRDPTSIMIQSICTIHGTGKHLTPERKAIARLIAHLPQAYAALDAMVDSFEDTTMDEDAYQITDSKAILQLSGYPAAAPCDSCQSGHATDGPIPGTLANGERCDACERFPSDPATKHAALRQHLTEEIEEIRKAIESENPGRAVWLCRTAITHITDHATQEPQARPTP